MSEQSDQGTYHVYLHSLANTSCFSGFQVFRYSLVLYTSENLKLDLLKIPHNVHVGLHVPVHRNESFRRLHTAVAI